MVLGRGVSPAVVPVHYPRDATAEIGLSLVDTSDTLPHAQTNIGADNEPVSRVYRKAIKIRSRLREMTTHRQEHQACSAEECTGRGGEAPIQWQFVVNVQTLK